MMRAALISAALCVGAGSALAETVRSDDYEAQAARHKVEMTARSGKTIAAEQVVVTVTRRDGAAISDGETAQATAFAVDVACDGAKPMVVLPVARAAGDMRYDVLCGAKG
ncbi:hypothetical protein [Roseovarius sp. E0-M6]|uniref:hypothetical protein n=1 Tax=Roseovarius sp. E0-M6 TaxID=3127118 RepID=UPI00300FE51C